MDKITVNAKKLKRLNEIVEKGQFKEVSFEFIVGSLFPNILKNIKEELRHQYTLGYIEGQKSKEGET